MAVKVEEAPVEVSASSRNTAAAVKVETVQVTAGACAGVKKEEKETTAENAVEPKTETKVKDEKCKDEKDEDMVSATSKPPKEESDSYSYYSEDEQSAGEEPQADFSRIEPPQSPENAGDEAEELATPSSASPCSVRIVTANSMENSDSMASVESDSLETSAEIIEKISARLGMKIDPANTKRLMKYTEPRSLHLLKGGWTRVANNEIIRARLAAFEEVDVEPRGDENLQRIAEPLRHALYLQAPHASQWKKHRGDNEDTFMAWQLLVMDPPIDDVFINNEIKTAYMK